jgi:hypothetical protein
MSWPSRSRDDASLRGPSAGTRNIWAVSVHQRRRVGRALASHHTSRHCQASPRPKRRPIGGTPKRVPPYDCWAPDCLFHQDRHLNAAASPTARDVGWDALWRPTWRASSSENLHQCRRGRRMHGSRLRNRIGTMAHSCRSGFHPEYVAERNHRFSINVRAGGTIPISTTKTLSARRYTKAFANSD